MYLLTWNEEERMVYAGLGGVVTGAEATVLAEELDQFMTSLHGASFSIEIDTVKASRVSAEATEELERLQFACAQRGVPLNVIREDPVPGICPKVLAILEGRAEAEAYVPLRKAA